MLLLHAVCAGALCVILLIGAFRRRMFPDAYSGKVSAMAVRKTVTHADWNLWFLFVKTADISRESLN